VALGNSEASNPRGILAGSRCFPGYFRSLFDRESTNVACGISSIWGHTDHALVAANCGGDTTATPHNAAHHPGQTDVPGLWVMRSKL
jgi:hypothetical protein